MGSVQENGKFSDYRHFKRNTKKQTIWWNDVIERK